ncbi:MAG: metal ABC transporter ATP-binding protein [Kiritimatiellia bacterium]
MTCISGDDTKTKTDAAAGFVPAASVADVCFSYGDSEVLHNISFTIPQRAMVAVIGPNGGGKSTLLHLLLGALRPQRGAIRVLGQAPAAARRRVGFVPQQIRFDPDFPISVIETVMLGRAAVHFMGGFRDHERALASAALKTVGLSALEGRRFADLSGGQRQRVFIAQALCADPELLLLDEPTANVDADTERDLYDLFTRLNETRTLVIVSHNLRVVTAHASHILCVNRTADIHLVGDDDIARLRPIDGHAGLAWISHSPPGHLEDLGAAADTTCCAAETATRDGRNSP